MHINLVLSGGAARGVAHIGVLKAAEEVGLDINAISGSSAGALVGVFYAEGYSPKEMLNVVKRTRWLRLFRPRISRRGLFSLSKAEAYFRRFVDKERVEELGKRVFICCTDLLSARPIYFSEGELLPVVLGSCALPGIFEPVSYGDYLLIDGGVMNNLPVEPLQSLKGLKIGVDVNPVEKVNSPGNIVNILLRSFFLAVRSNVESRRDACDVVIVPDIFGYSPLDIGSADELFAIGYEAGIKVFRDLVQ